MPNVPASSGRVVNSGMVCHAKHCNVSSMSDLDPRVRAVCDLNVAEAREYGGRHEYDGVPQDLSPAGVTARARQLAAARKAGLRAARPARRGAPAGVRGLQPGDVYADLELHRRNPLFHLGELDLACYDKDYAPAPNGTRPAPRTWRPGPR